MHIDGIKNKPLISTLKKKTASPKDISFVSMLEGQIQPADETTPIAKTVEISSGPSAPAATRLAGLASSERTIDVLAALGDALENLTIKPDDLLPLVDALESETTTILDIKEQLDDSDPLSELLDRVAAVAYLESEKFRRGDYGH
jgi:hypothetical protein